VKTLIIFLVVIVALFFVFVGIYNKLIELIEAVKNDKKQIDIQLDRRYKVFESLINVVKKYMNYEQTTLKDVVALRNKAQTAASVGDEKTRIDAENGISKLYRSSAGIPECWKRFRAERRFAGSGSEPGGFQGRMEQILRRDFIL